MKIFVTGGAGFIGSNYVRWVFANTDHEITVYDSINTREDNVHSSGEHKKIWSIRKKYNQKKSYSYSDCSKGKSSLCVKLTMDKIVWLGDGMATGYGCTEMCDCSSKFVTFCISTLTLLNLT